MLVNTQAVLDLPRRWGQLLQQVFTATEQNKKLTLLFITVIFSSLNDIVRLQKKELLLLHYTHRNWQISTNGIPKQPFLKAGLFSKKWFLSLWLLGIFVLKRSTTVRWGENKHAVQCLLPLRWKVLGESFWFRMFPSLQSSLEVQKLENTQCCWRLHYKGSGVAILKYRHLDNDLSSGRVNHMWTSSAGLFTLHSVATVS